MKTKCSLIALFIAAAVVVNAQGLRFGAKGGLNVATVKFNNSILDSDNTTGFHIGPILEIMTPVPGIGVDLAVLFTQKGAEVHNSWPSDVMAPDDIVKEFEELGETTKSNFIEIPINLKWKMMLPAVKPFLAAGPYISIPLSGDKIWSVPHSNFSEQFKNRSFGAGLNFAAGAEILSTVQLSVNYNLGLTDHFKWISFDQPFKARTRTWVISAAVFF